MKCVLYPLKDKWKVQEIISQKKNTENILDFINNNENVKYVLYPLKDKSVLCPSFKFQVSYCTTYEQWNQADSIFVFEWLIKNRVVSPKKSYTWPRRFTFDMNPTTADEQN